MKIAPQRQTQKLQPGLAFSDGPPGSTRTIQLNQQIPDRGDIAYCSVFPVVFQGDQRQSNGNMSTVPAVSCVSSTGTGDRGERGGHTTHMTQHRSRRVHSAQAQAAHRDRDRGRGAHSTALSLSQRIARAAAALSTRAALIHSPQPSCSLLLLFPRGPRQDMPKLNPTRHVTRDHVFAR